MFILMSHVTRMSCDTNGIYVTLKETWTCDLWPPIILPLAPVITLITFYLCTFALWKSLIYIRCSRPFWWRVQLWNKTRDVSLSAYRPAVDDVCTCQAVRLAVRVPFSVLHEQLQLVFASFWEVHRAAQLEGDVRKHSLLVGVGAGQCRDKWIVWGSPGMQHMEVYGDPRLPEHITFNAFSWLFTCDLREGWWTHCFWFMRIPFCLLYMLTLLYYIYHVIDIP